MSDWNESEVCITEWERRLYGCHASAVDDEIDYNALMWTAVEPG